MLNSNVYTLQVVPGTRNHRGCFVQETDYKLVSINEAGWAFICLDDMSCHYVDPANTYETAMNTSVEVIA